jgi:hypothetical protein
MTHLHDEVLLAEWEHDLTTGLIGTDAHRPLFPHERQARFNALGAETEIVEAAARLTNLLLRVRDNWIGTLATDIRSRATVQDALDRLSRVDANLSILAAPIMQSAVFEAEQILIQAAIRGAERVAFEAATQLVSVIPEIGSTTAWVRTEAGLVVRSPIASITGTIRGNVERAQHSTVNELADTITDIGRRSSILKLESDYGRVPVQQAWGRGRTATAETVPEEPSGIYASELLDKRVCRRGRADFVDRCAEIDGKQYPSRQAAWEDYPASTYLHCLGGMRCRGTLVYVWGNEKP